MSKKVIDETSKFLSYVLRHEPQAIGLTLDTEGWGDIDALISGAARDGRREPAGVRLAGVERGAERRRGAIR